MKTILRLSALIVAGSAAPQLLRGGVGVGHGIGVAYSVGYNDLGKISPYTYQYGVADEVTGARFDQVESDDGTGAREGHYSVNLPDGRIQHVNYHADDIAGYVAEVTYDGTAAYPEAVAVGHGVGIGHGVGHGVVSHGVVAHPVAVATAHPVVSHRVVAPVAVATAHPAVVGHGIVGHGVGIGHGIVGHGVGIGHGIGHGVGRVIG